MEQKRDQEVNSPLIIGKGPKNVRWRKDSLFNKWCWENWISACRNLKPGPCLSPCTKVSSRWIEDLHVRTETLKLLQENTEKTPEDTVISRDFLQRTPTTHEIGPELTNGTASHAKASARPRTQLQE
jgi:hypothetical protein